MKQLAGYQLPELIPFAMLLWEDTFYQVLYERASPILSGKHSIALFPVYSQMASFTLGLD